MTITESRRQLRPLRADIEHIDRVLVELIAQRVALSRQIGTIKRQDGVAIIDPAHEAAVVRRATSLARDHAVDAEAVRDVLWRLIRLCREAQLKAE